MNVDMLLSRKVGVCLSGKFFMIFSPDVSTPAGIKSDLVLAHGTGIHPMQWLTNIFMHADPMHLIGNMLFLWIFGLVVEGKLGWWKFLLVYLGIGIFQSAMVQIMMGS